MKVKLHLEGKDNFTDEQWAMIHNAFEFFIHKHKMSKYPYSVYVKFPSKLTASSGFDITRAYCITQLYEEHGKIKPSKFIIHVSRESTMNKLLESIFHEMTHVLQELRGDFHRTGDGSEYYQGVHYSVDILTKPTYKQYRDFPWEVEAREVSKDMLKQWYMAYGKKQTFIQKLINFWRTL